jgi:cell division protease FtsH
MKNLVKNILIFVIFFLVIASVLSFSNQGGSKVERVGLEKLISQINNGSVSQIIINKDNLEIKLKDNSKQLTKKEAGDTFSDLIKNFSVDQKKLAEIKIDVKDNSGWDLFLTSVLPFLLPLLIIGIFIFFMMRGVQGVNNRAMGFGQTQAKDQNNKENKVNTKFEDVAGIKEAKEELEEVVDFLKNSKKFTDLGARIPRGVLLIGAPGTGKTLLAKAVAGEAGVPFFNISGSEFVEMFVGVGASRVRDLFKKAKKNAPCIIFIDEIDAVGRRRGAGLGGSHDEREQTLNQILVEMDGFENNTGIIVVAATNRPDVLDPALLRPGRFDRQVILDEPDIADREDILKIHAKKKPLSKNVNLRKIAERTPGFSGADLANVLNEAAILAARTNKKTISEEEILEAIEKVMLGPAKKSKILSKKEKDITAYHEAGHALVAHFLPNTDPIHKISIISRGMAGGYTIKLPTEDKHLRSKVEFIEEIAVLLGGWVAEKNIFNDVTTGATSDLRRATALARKLITDYGMSENLGPRTFGTKEEMIFLGREIHEQRDYSEKVAEEIDKEINNFISKAREVAENIVSEKKDDLKKIADYLIEKETIERKEFEELLGKKPEKM